MKIGLCGAFLDFMDVDSISEMAIRVGFEAVSITGKQIAEFKHEEKKDSCLKELCWHPQDGISLTEAAKKAEALGADILVIPGQCASSCESEICLVTDTTNLQIAFENSCEGESVIELIDHWNGKHTSERFGACLNTGHALICGEKPERMVGKLGSRLISIHANDNHGKDDYHLMPYRGRNFMDWTSFLIALADTRYEGVLYLDVYSELARQSHKLAEGWFKSQACLAQFMQETVSAYQKPETRVLKVKEWLREELKFGTIGILADYVHLDLMAKDKEAADRCISDCEMDEINFNALDLEQYVEVYDEVSDCMIRVSQNGSVNSGEVGMLIEAARLRKDYEEIRQWALFLRHYHKGNYDLTEVFCKEDGKWVLKGRANKEQGMLFCMMVYRLRRELEAEI